MAILLKMRPFEIDSSPLRIHVTDEVPQQPLGTEDSLAEESQNIERSIVAHFEEHFTFPDAT
jgi:hypothetical protein